jgi:hypothetical protein
MSFALCPSPAQASRVTVDLGHEQGGASGQSVSLYQESSGGENWQSRNHVNRHGVVPHSHRGYRLLVDGTERTGCRASPVVTCRSSRAAISLALPEFWQQFPKALDADAGSLRVGLFPREYPDEFELQGGEQKTQTIWLELVGPDGDTKGRLAWTRQPTLITPAADWVSSTKAVFDFYHGSGPPRLEAYLGEAIAGPQCLTAKREVIDEYGWRHFGDVYADHEGAYYTGSSPVISHYNNQYDVVLGALREYLRTGDRRWWEIADPLARHVCDIDIYHTTEDRPAYNGGLFWLTDHYKDAATATHRTYSRANRVEGRDYGGGPGPEHNFTSGLILYYCLTGSPDAAEAVLSLAEWVLAMEDGRRTVFGLLDDGPTGGASFTADRNYFGPGRGAGNSINALLDAWVLTHESRYLLAAEDLIRRTIHPCDDPADRNLLDVERRWSYTMYLTVLSRYVALKDAAGEPDLMSRYARAALARYAEWMARHELPYFDQREKLEFPTETWAAQDLRKANVLRRAAALVGGPNGSLWLAKADELSERAWQDLLSFPSKHVARAVAIVLQEGPAEAALRSQEVAARNGTVGDDFGSPTAFRSQRDRVKALARSPLRLLALLPRLLNPVRWQSALEGLR